MLAMTELNDEIQVWLAPAAHDTPGPIETFCETLLLEEERVAANRFRVNSARHQHVIGRAMARCLLSSGCCEHHEIGFRILDHGKPIVDQPEVARRAFNIAHTRGLVVCGLGQANQWLGVDVEWMDRRTDPALAERYFAPAEIQQLQSLRTDDERQKLFLRIWTLKEAFIKAIGTGLSTPLDQFAFEEAKSNEPTLTLADPDLARDREWTFRAFEPRPGFVAAVAVGEEFADSKGAKASSRPVRLMDFESQLP